MRNCWMFGAIALVAFAGCSESVSEGFDAASFDLCMAAPGVPGIDWPEPVIRATCRSQADSVIYPEVFRAAIEKGDAASLDSQLARMWDEVRSGARHERSIETSLRAFAWAAPEAEAAANRWVELAPNSAFARTARGNARFARASVARGEALPDDLPPGALERMREALVPAAEDYEAARRLRPDFSVPYVWLVDIARLNGDDERKAALASDIEREVPGSYFARAALLHASEPRWGGSLDEMRSVAERAQRESDPMLRVLVGQDVAYSGLAAYWAKDYGKALAKFEEGLRVGGPSFFYMELAAYAAFATEQYERSLAWGEQLVRFAPSDSIGYSARFRVHYARRDWAALAADADRLLRWQAANAEALIASGDALQGLGRSAESLPRYEQALQSEPRNASALRKAAERLIYDAKRPADAIPLLLRRLEDAPADGDALCTLVLATFQTRDMRIYGYIDRALEHADPADERQRKCVEQAHHFLGEHPRPEPFDETAEGTW